jgi:hypothetical protein
VISAQRPEARSWQRFTPWVLLAWVVANYGWTTTFGFINDDYDWVARAALLLHDSDASGPRMSFFLRPVVEASFVLNYLVAGSSPFLYHAVNVALEAINVLLVWHLARTILSGGLPAFLAAVLFASHPSHPGAATWVCGRAELLSTACCLGALHFHMKGRTVPAAVLFAMAMFARESAVPFPLLGLAVDVLLATPARPRLRALAGYALALAVYAAARAQWTTLFAWQYSGLDAIVRRDLGGFIDVVSRQALAAAAALLEPLYLPEGIAAALLAVISLLTIGKAATRGRWRPAAFAVLWMPITALPFLGWAMFHPRYAYLLSVGLSLLLVNAGWELVRANTSKLRLGLLVSVAIMWVAASVVRTQLRNEQLRRNAFMSARVVAAVQRAVPRPQPRALFVVDGLGPLRLGRDTWARTPVLVFGFPEALRLAYGDFSLDATFPGGPAPAMDRPLVQLRWDGSAIVAAQ